MDWESLFSRSTGTTIEELEKGIKAAAMNPIAGWQDVMYRLYPLLPRLLKHVDVANHFFNDPEINYSSILTTHITYTTIQNASEILNLLSQGQLRIIGGYQSTDLTTDHKFTIRCKEAVIESDYLIHGNSVTPMLSQITKEQSQLWLNLRESGSVQKIDPEYLGGLKGVEYDRNTYRLRSSTLSNCFLIGPMTYFLTDIVLFRTEAAAVVEQLINSIFQ